MLLALPHPRERGEVDAIEPGKSSIRDLCGLRGILLEHLLEHAASVDDRVAERLDEEFVHQSVVEQPILAALTPPLVLVLEHLHAMLAAREVRARVG